MDASRRAALTSPGRPVGYRAEVLRRLHSSIGASELACLGYVWFCALTRRRDHLLGVSMAVLVGEGAALLVAKGCPLGLFQRRAAG